MSLLKQYETKLSLQKERQKKRDDLNRQRKLASFPVELHSGT